MLPNLSQALREFKEGLQPNIPIYLKKAKIFVEIPIHFKFIKGYLIKFQSFYFHKNKEIIHLQYYFYHYLM